MQAKIVKRIDVEAPIERVWTAITDHHEFGAWFGVEMEDPFEVGKISMGKLVNEGCEGMVFSAVTIELIEPSLFSYRWPHDEAFTLDNPKRLESTSLVEFHLQPCERGTRVTVIESNFESLTDDALEHTVKNNSSGWSAQVKNIRDYVER